MNTRSSILNKVLDLYKEQQNIQKQINSLYEEAKQIEDKEDDNDKSGFSYLDNIESYTL